MITAGLTTSFKKDILLGVHDFETDVLKIALYTSDAVLGPDTQGYTTVAEVTGVGYTQGGQILANVVVQSSLTQSIAYVNFDDPTWDASTFATRGALIYNSSKSNKSIAVLNFGINQTMLSQQFQIQLPPDNVDSAIIRIS